MTTRPGFTFRCYRDDRVPWKPADTRTAVPICAPHLLDSNVLVSLNDEYVFSVGAHPGPDYWLMDRAAAEPLTVEKSFTASALLAFALDIPIVPCHEAEEARPSPNRQEFSRNIRQAGLHSGRDYFEALAHTAEAAGCFVWAGLRQPVLPMRVVPVGPNGTWPFLSLPLSASTWRGLTAYWSGLLSIAVPGRILNFWRAIEAVTTKQQRYEILERLESKPTKSGWTRLRTIGPRQADQPLVNTALLLKRQAVKRRNQLISTHGSAQDAVDWLYWERRGKAAHADKSSLDFEGLASFADQLRDAMLFQHMARVAIESKWL